MSEIAISLEKVSKYYKLYGDPKDRLKEALHPLGKKYHRKFYPLEDISLDIRKGEVVGVVGKNGSGKSTLLKIISGVLTPNSGTLQVRGKVAALLELGAGFNPEFTGLENIYFYARIMGLSREEIDGKLEQIIRFADIGEFIEQPLKSYSSGMKSRLGFAVVAHLDPEILIVDEVLAVGDIQFQKKCYDHINELFRSGTTVIMVSHSAQAISRFCNRAVLLHNKKIVMDGDPGEVIALYQQLVFANKEQLKKVERGIGKGSPDKTEQTIKSAPSKKSQNHSAPSSVQDYKINEDYYLHNLEFEAAVINENVAQFRDINLLDDSDRRVNLLRRGERYCLQFKLVFHRDCNDVSLGAQIIGLDGLLISGANTRDYMKHSLPLVSKDEEVVVNWYFDCSMVAGTYSFNIFATTNREEETVLMNNAMAFKVEVASGSNGGLVNLKQQIEVFCSRSLEPISISEKAETLNG